MNNNQISDSTRYYNWRILDRKYHKNQSKDTIEIIQISKDGNEKHYKFIAK